MKLSYKRGRARCRWIASARAPRAPLSLPPRLGSSRQLAPERPEIYLGVCPRSLRDAGVGAGPAALTQTSCGCVHGGAAGGEKEVRAREIKCS